jgi:exo-1,4-beta-D-glucosaminidase
MAALLGNGRFPGIECSTRVRDDVDPTMFEVPWWFRTTFTSTGSARTLLRSDGIIHSADLFVNGVQVADRGVISGAYTTNTFDITALVRPGRNAIAYLVHPGTPKTDLSIGWVDWNVWPPDHNMGVWRDVWILRTGPVCLARPRVTSELSNENRQADLTVSVDVANRSETAARARLRVAITLGGTPTQSIMREVDLAAGAETRITLTPSDEPSLRMADPPLWWPIGMGAQHLFDLEITASVDGAPSDRASTRFGIRSVASEIEAGEGRRLFVNGRPVQVMGAGWAPDLWLRHDEQRLRDELSYAIGLGLNAIRLEGKLENPEIYDLADEAGLMMLPGWECCDKWEAHAGSGEPWDEHDFEVAGRSMSSEAHRLGNHPSVVGFFIGSDFPPEPRAARIYLDALAEARFDVPVVPSATAEASEVAGPSGMKMTGPYAWVPPEYWYRTDPRLGGAIGFNSETGAGNNLPRLPSLRRFLSDGELETLWRVPDAKQIHAAPPSEFDNLAVFHRALAARYGQPTSLRDFVRKAQLMNYEAVRAQFEAYRSRAWAEQPATGMVYWMLNSAWPSLNWQLWDWYLDPPAAYSAARRANEPLHALYAYDERALLVVNGTSEPATMRATAVVRDVEGREHWSRSEALADVPDQACIRAFDVVVPDGVGPTYFLEMWLERDGTELSPAHNVYWLSTVPDELAIEDTTWRYTPVREFADLRQLEGLEAARVAVTATSSVAGPLSEAPPLWDGAGGTKLSVEVENSGDVPAVGVHVSLVGHASGIPLAPILWDDNDVVLFPGCSAVITASVPAIAPEANGMLVEVDAFNLGAPFQVVAAAR